MSLQNRHSVSNYPGSDPIWADLIGDMEYAGEPELAAKWAKRLCRAGLYHHGANSCVGLLVEGTSVTEEWTCWNCDFRMIRVTTMGKRK